MASAINNGTFTFNKEELKDWSKVIHAMTYQNSALTDLHAVEEGIKYNEQIVFSSNTGLLGKAPTGCTPNEITGVTLSEKMWSPAKEDFRLKHCSTDVNVQDKLVNQMAKMNPDFYNIIEGSQSGIGDFLVASIMERMNENILRKVWFNDTAADTIANGGVLTNGTDKGYFNTFNGLFKEIFVDVPTSASNYVLISKNQQTTYANQALASGDAIAILKSMYLKADARLRSLKTAKFYVTQTIWDGYLNDLENIQNSGAGNTMINEKGQLKLYYRGYELVLMDIWDRTINAYQNTGAKWNLPHRAVFTVKENIPVGTLASGDFGTVDAFYDKVTKMNYIDGIYSLDAVHLESYLTVAAY